MTDILPSISTWAYCTKFDSQNGQAIFRFPNQYGASVINHPGSYGTELAVIQWMEDDEWTITYDTPITDDVIGWIKNEEELLQLLNRIREL